MLQHEIQDYGRQWHRVLPCLVWALREVANKTTLVSPNFLLFGVCPAVHCLCVTKLGLVYVSMSRTLVSLLVSIWMTLKVKVGT